VTALDKAKELQATLLAAGIDRVWFWTCPHCQAKNMLTWNDGKSYDASCESCEKVTRLHLKGAKRGSQNR
jgi:hypothetical protein